MSTADLESRVLRTLSEYQMLQNGDTVIVALSGGGDSMALFHFLSLHAEALGVRLRAAHVNHGIRGAASDADEAFVRAQCARRGVELDVLSLALGKNASEEQARRARYEFFEQLCVRFGAKLATAHTADDRAETVLLNLARGTSVRGAAGIPHARGNIVRPMLDTDRSQVREYLARFSVEFRTDETNESDAYARNRVRHLLVPALEQVHEGAARHLAEFADDARDISDYLDEQAKLILAAALRSHPAEVLLTYEVQTLLDAPAAVRRTALRQMLAPEPDISRARIAACEELLRTGGCVPLHGHACFRVRQDLARVEPASARAQEWEIPFSQGVFPLPDGRNLCVERISAKKYEKMGKESQNALFSCADYDKIKNSTLFRTRRAGDRIALCGRAGTRELKKLTSELRLSAAARAAMVLCARGSEVLWAQGLGCSREVRPTESTKEIALITIKKRGTL